MTAFSSNYARRLARWDIETGPEPEHILRQFYEPMADFDEAACKAEFATARKEDQKAIDFIAAKKAEREQEQKEHWINYVKRAALSPVTGRIVAIGIRENGQSRITTARNDEEEREMIAGFIKESAEVIALGGTLEGFNTDGFDLPFVFRRALKHRVPTDTLRRGRYWHESFRDLLGVWRAGNRQEFISLDKVAIFLGTEHRKNGDGAHFAEIFETDPAKALAYIDNDLIMTDEVGDAMAPEVARAMLPIRPSPPASAATAEPTRADRNEGTI